jgi:hypothetical protein
MDGDYSGMDADAAAGPSDYGGGGLGQGDIAGWGIDANSTFAGQEDLGGWGGSLSQADISGWGLEDGTSVFGGAIDNGNWGAPEDDSFFSKVRGIMNNPLGKMAIGRANPTLGMVNSMASMAGKVGNSPTRGGALGTIGGYAGGFLGGVFGGPAGAMAGSYAGGQLGNAMGGNQQGYSGPSMGQGPGQSGGGMNIAGGLGALYQYYRNSKDIGGQIGGLQGMYGQNSAYAKALRQQLARRDAAGGRRSQYGPREVELQAALANANSRNAPTLAGLYQQKMANRNNMLNTVGLGIQQAGGFGGIGRGLQSLWGGGITDDMQLPESSYDGLYDMPEGPGYVDIPDVSGWGG